jgi:hypothetical protein
MTVSTVKQCIIQASQTQEVPSFNGMSFYCRIRKAFFMLVLHTISCYTKKKSLSDKKRGQPVDGRHVMTPDPDGKQLLEYVMTHRKKTSLSLLFFFVHSLRRQGRP